MATTITKRQLWIIAGILLLVIGLVLLFRDNEKRYDWTEDYAQDSRDPYGADVLRQLLEAYYPGQELVVMVDSLRGNLPTDGEAAAANYVFVGEALYLDSADVQSLLSFVAGGNRAFLSSRTIPFDLMFYLYYYECENAYWDDYATFFDTAATMRLLRPAWNPDSAHQYRYRKKDRYLPYRWQYIEQQYFCQQDSGLRALGYFKDSLVNFAQAPYGDGYFYLHTAPLAFANISMLDTPAVQYAEKVFSHLEEGPIYWDEYSKVSEAVGRSRNRGSDRTAERRLNTESPLSYVLSQPPLAWAWYLLLATGLLYLLFGAKRRQRIIPVKEPNTNTSLEFLATIGRLYFLQGNHRRLAQQKMKLFRYFVHDRYQLQVVELDEAFAEALATRSEAPREEIDHILKIYRNIDSSSFVSENTLVDFHRRLYAFYQACK